MKKVAKIIAIIGIVLIISGLIIEIVILNNKLKDTKNTLDTQLSENLKLKYENEALWENYYMNVSEYGGEYYE